VRCFYFKKYLSFNQNKQHTIFTSFKTWRIFLIFKNFNKFQQKGWSNDFKLLLIKINMVFGVILKGLFFRIVSVWQFQKIENMLIDAC
jgi:competence CoiA-like predicted nuclease